MVNMHYAKSVPDFVKAMIPDHTWHPWLFVKAPGGFWEVQSNHVKYLEWLGAQLGHNGDLTKWYDVSLPQLRKHQGSIVKYGDTEASYLYSLHFCLAYTWVIRYYNGSLITALRTNYPSHRWEPWRMKNVSRNHWGDIKNQREYFDALGKEFGVNKFEDWYNIKVTQLYAKGASKVIKGTYNGALAEALETIYPNHKWESWRFFRVRY
jgi:hypothetical protein